MADVEDTAPRERGRPSIYDEDMVVRVLEAIATTPKALKTICDSRDDLPSHDTIYRWLWLYPDFSDRYVRAKEAQQELMADEVMQIADDSRYDTYKTFDKAGEIVEKIDHEVVNRSKQRIEVRLWLMERMAHRRFKRLEERQVSHTFATLTDEELIEKAKQIVGGQNGE